MKSTPKIPPVQSSPARYQYLMETVRHRLDTIRSLQASALAPFVAGEMAAFNGRKVVEGIAFACLVALENGIDFVPRDAKNQWNAEIIFGRLQSKGFETLPSPSIMRESSADELTEDPAIIRCVGQPERRLSHEELSKIYQRLHAWNHELNPFVWQNRAQFADANVAVLWDDLAKLESFIVQHTIGIKNESFYCTLRSHEDGQTKVVPLSRCITAEPQADAGRCF